MVITLMECIAQVESANNSGAIRFESYQYESNPYNVNASEMYSLAGGWVDCDTAMMLSYTSWGCYQIMGYNLVRQGFTGILASFLTCEREQTFALNRFFRASKIPLSPTASMSSLTQKELELVGSIYNGDGRVYAHSLRLAYQAIKAKAND